MYILHIDWYYRVIHVHTPIHVQSNHGTFLPYFQLLIYLCSIYSVLSTTFIQRVCVYPVIFILVFKYIFKLKSYCTRATSTCSSLLYLRDLVLCVEGQMIINIIRKNYQMIMTTVPHNENIFYPLKQIVYYSSGKSIYPLKKSRTVVYELLT